MRLPFVSRDAHEALRTALETQILRLQRELEKEQHRSEHLLDTVLSLKVSGATSIVRAAAPGTVKVEQPPRSSIQQAIDENPIASANPRLRAYLASWADKELRRRPRDVDEDAWLARIEAKLRSWSAVSGDDDDDDDGDDDDDVIAVGVS